MVQLILKLLLNKHFWIILGVATILAIMLRSCATITALTAEVEISHQNIAALTDSTRNYKLINGQSESARLTLVSKANRLERVSADLAAELAKEKSLGNVKYLTKETISVSLPAIATKNEPAGPDSGPAGTTPTQIRWRAEKDVPGIISYRLQGLTRLDSTFIDSLCIDFSKVSGYRDNKGRLESFSRANYAGIKITGLESAVLDPTQLVKPQGRFWLGCECLGIGIGIGAAGAELVRWYLREKDKP